MGKFKGGRVSAAWPNRTRLWRHPVFLLWLCAFAWWAGRWFWVWWPQASRPVVSASVEQVRDSSRLAAARLFGEADVGSALPSGAINLVGVNTDRRRGFALLEEGGKTLAYFRGDTLPDGRKVVDILPDGVRVERAGMKEVLPLVRARAANP